MRILRQSGLKPRLPVVLHHKHEAFHGHFRLHGRPHRGVAHTPSGEAAARQLLRPGEPCSGYRVASKRNQARRSASSIQTSIMLVVA